NEARRSGAAGPRPMRRFRRRTIGLVLLAGLGVCYDLSNRFISQGAERNDPDKLVMELIFYGVFFGLLVALLILAAKDFHDVAEGYLEEQQKVTLQTLLEMEKELRGKGEVSEGNKLIPPIEFPKKE